MVAKVGRNQPCPCGSGKKYKMCHGKDEQRTLPAVEKVREKYMDELLNASGIAVRGQDQSSPDLSVRDLKRQERELTRLMQRIPSMSPEQLDALGGILNADPGSLDLSTLPPETPRDSAEILVRQAMRESSRKRKITMARRALEMFPDLPEAYLLLAEQHTKHFAEHVDFLRQAVAAAERLAGPEAFATQVGRFAESDETFAYLHSRAILTLELWSSTRPGDREEALVCATELLTLDGEDRYAMRKLMVIDRFTRGDIAGARALMEADTRLADESEQWTWALMFYALLGDQPLTRRILEAARDWESDTEKWLLDPRGTQRLWDAAPKTGVAPSVAYGYFYREAWDAVPGAIEWLDALRRGEREISEGYHGLRVEVHDPTALTTGLCPDCASELPLQTMPLILFVPPWHLVSVDVPCTYCGICTPDVLTVSYADAELRLDIVADAAGLDIDIAILDIIGSLDPQDPNVPRDRPVSPEEIVDDITVFKPIEYVPDDSWDADTFDDDIDDVPTIDLPPNPWVVDVPGRVNPPRTP